MFEDDHVLSNTVQSQILKSTVEDTREKIDRAIVKFAYLSQEVEGANRRLQELNLQHADARREIDRLQEAHVNLMVNKIRSN